MSEATTDAEFTMLWLLDYTRNRINDASMFMVQAKCTFSSQTHLKYHWIMESFTDKVWPQHKMHISEIHKNFSFTDGTNSTYKLNQWNSLLGVKQLNITSTL